jgi:hypothetical protein
MVHGGEAPVVGAQVYLYAANTSGTWPTGYGIASVVLRKNCVLREKTGVAEAA